MKRYVYASTEEEFVSDSRYTVSGTSASGSGDIEYTDDPVQAITMWFKLSRRYGMNTCITTTRRTYALELLQAATPELLTKLHNKFKCKYKLDWLIDAVKRQLDSGARTFYENDLGDMIHPFDVG